MIYRIASANEEGGERLYSVNTSEFLGENGQVSGLRIVEVEGPATRFAPIEGTERVIPAQLVLLAMGFLGPEADGVVSQLGVELTRAAISSRRSLSDQRAGRLRLR